MGCTCGIWKRFCSLRTSAYSALEVSRLCAIEIHVDIDTDIDMFGCNFPAVEMSMGIFRGSPREICGEKCQWGLSEAIPGKNLTNRRAHTQTDRRILTGVSKVWHQIIWLSTVCYCLTLLLVLSCVLLTVSSSWHRARTLSSSAQGLSAPAVPLPGTVPAIFVSHFCLWTASENICRHTCFLSCCHGIIATGAFTDLYSPKSVAHDINTKLKRKENSTTNSTLSRRQYCYLTRISWQIYGGSFLPYEKNYLEISR